ncbi:MAG: ABC transporter substrate-binding protein [Candidatus Rokubacteria bacterium]|nr:ABC transporter substrate-binding protein [Candidatus Rokubacteria bacterium]
MMHRPLVLAILVITLSAPPWARAAEKIRVGLDVGVNSLPFWVAMEKGLFAKHGLQVSDKVFDAGYLGLLAIGAGEGDSSSQSDAPTLTLIGKGIDALVVAVVARSADNYKIVAKKDIQTAPGLKGRKFGMTLGSASEYVGMKYLAKQGFGRADVNVVNADPSELAPLLARGEIDAACFWEPWGRKTVALAPDRLHVMGTGKDIYAVNMYLTVRRKFAAEQRQAVTGLLRGLMEANAYIKANRKEVTGLFQKKHRLDWATAEASVNDFDYVLILDQPIISTMTEVGKWLLENKKLSTLPDFAKLIDPSFLRDVAPAAVTYRP